MIPYGRQHIGDEELDALKDVLISGWLTQGPKVPEFERAVANFCDAKYAVAVTNGTSALHIACMALSLCPNDRLWTTPNSFVASANCGRYCGAEVDFVDIDPLTRNLCPRLLREKLQQAALDNRLPKILVVVHFAGYCSEMAEIYALSRRYGFSVIEDAAHAMGSLYKNEKVGSGRYSDLSIFSFHPVKNMTTAEGGMVLCNDKALLKKLLAARSHGIVQGEVVNQQGEEPWYYEQQTLGYNYRMNDMQAALGLVQLKRLPDFIQSRRELVANYDKHLAALPVKRVIESNEHKTAWHLYVIELPQSVDRTEAYKALKAKGIGVQIHYIPIHLQPYYQQLGFQRGDYPNAEHYYEHALSLPLFHGLTVLEQEQVITAVKEVLA